MAIVKTDRPLVASTSNAAGGTITSDALDLSTAFGLAGIATITNGATAPTVPCTFYLEVSFDGGTTWEVWQSVPHNLVASSSQPYRWLLPAEIKRMRVRFAGNTGQAVTVKCMAGELTSI